MQATSAQLLFPASFLSAVRVSSSSDADAFLRPTAWLAVRRHWQSRNFKGITNRMICMRVMLHGWLVKMEGIAEWFLLRHRPECSTSPIFKVAHVSHVANVLDARRPRVNEYAYGTWSLKRATRGLLGITILGRKYGLGYFLGKNRSDDYLQMSKYNRIF